MVWMFAMTKIKTNARIYQLDITLNGRIIKVLSHYDNTYDFHVNCSSLASAIKCLLEFCCKFIYETAYYIRTQIFWSHKLTAHTVEIVMYNYPHQICLTT